MFFFHAEDYSETADSVALLINPFIFYSYVSHLRDGNKNNDAI